MILNILFPHTVQDYCSCVATSFLRSLMPSIRVELEFSPPTRLRHRRLHSRFAGSRTQTGTYEPRNRFPGYIMNC